MKRCTWIAALAALVGCETPVFPCGLTDGVSADCPSQGEIVTYVLRTVDLPAPDLRGRTVGFDLDGAPGTGGARCDDAVDFTSSITGAPDVDNQLAAHPSAIIDATDLSTLVESQIAAGELLVVLEVSDIDSYDDDPSVSVRLMTATLPRDTPMAMVGADGRLTQGQTFFPGTTIATFPEAAIVDSRLELSFERLPLSLFLGPGASALTLEGARLSAEVRPTDLVHGELGGAIPVADLVAFTEALGSPLTEAEIRAAFLPDLDPSADGATCGAISAGFSFEHTTAANF